MSAILRITRSIDNHIWKITFRLDPSNFAELDEQLMARFGEPEINVGNVIGGLDALTSYTLPEKYIKIRSGLPYTQEFDSRTPPFDTFTRKKAEAYQAAFVTRYTQALADLRANTLYSAELLSALEHASIIDQLPVPAPAPLPSGTGGGGGGGGSEGPEEPPFSGDYEYSINLN
jgi:hypothetical protein